jgi:quercetin dioxygenase-like cupin family protein
MPRIEVVRKNELQAGISTPGILREKAFETEEVLLSRSTVAGEVVSDWHHHGKRHLYGFLVSGRLRLEFGPKGKEAVDLHPGDYFHIPPGLIHRDVNPNKRQKFVVAGILLGKGPAVVNVKGP